MLHLVATISPTFEPTVASQCPGCRRYKPQGVKIPSLMADFA